MASAIKHTSSTTIGLAADEGATAKVVAVNQTNIIRLHVGWISQPDMFKALGHCDRRQAKALIEALTAILDEGLCEACGALDTHRDDCPKGK